MQHEPGILIQLVPLLLIGIGMAFLSFNLARSKGYAVVAFTIFGLIPLLNMFTTAYLIGAPDRILRAQLEALSRGNVTR